MNVRIPNGEGHSNSISLAAWRCFSPSMALLAWFYLPSLGCQFISLEFFPISMNTKPYAVVIEWGSRRHFESFHDTEDEAQLKANARSIYLYNMKRGKRGVKARVSVWHLVSSGVQPVGVIFPSDDGTNDTEVSPTQQAVS